LLFQQIGNAAAQGFGEPFSRFQFHLAGIVYQFAQVTGEPPHRAGYLGLGAVAFDGEEFLD